MNIVEWLEDIWYVKIKNLHKHDYKRISDAPAGVNSIWYQRHQCTKCGNIVGLDDWQVADLPTTMKYQKLVDIQEEMKKKDLIWREQ